MTTARTALLVGGPGHGRLVAVQSGQITLRVPVPRGPSFFATPVGDGYLAPCDEVKYIPRDLFLFGRVLRIWAPDYLADSALNDAAFNLLLSDDAKAAAL